MNNQDLKRDFENILTEVRLGEVDSTIGRVIIEAEKYIGYLEDFETRARKFEAVLEKMAATNDPEINKVLETYFKEFEA